MFPPEVMRQIVISVNVDIFSVWALAFLGLGVVLMLLVGRPQNSAPKLIELALCGGVPLILGLFLLHVAAPFPGQFHVVLFLQLFGLVYVSLVAPAALERYLNPKGRRDFSPRSFLLAAFVLSVVAQIVLLEHIEIGFDMPEPGLIAALLCVPLVIGFFFGDLVALPPSPGSHAMRLPAIEALHVPAGGTKPASFESAAAMQRPIATRAGVVLDAEPPPPPAAPPVLQPAPVPESSPAAPITADTPSPPREMPMAESAEPEPPAQVQVQVPMGTEVPAEAEAPVSETVEVQRPPSAEPAPTPNLPAVMPSQAVSEEIPQTGALPRMQLKLSHSQRKGLTGKIIFALNARIEVPAEERALIARYRLGDVVIYDSTARKRRAEAASAHLESTRDSPSFSDSAGAQLLGAGKTAYRLARAGVSATMAALSLRITVDGLIRGVHVECKDLNELLGTKAAIVNAAENLRTYLDVAATFDGREEILEF
jgi:hypothetical protein